MSKTPVSTESAEEYCRSLLIEGSNKTSLSFLYKLVLVSLPKKSQS